MPKTSEVLDALVKLAQLFNTFKPILDGALDNEANRVGLSREERKALFDRINTETDAITTADMGEGE